MANLVSILKDILLGEDKVTIPGFGTFETRYQSAQLDEKTGVIYPPTKAVSLNVDKKEDGESRLSAALQKLGYSDADIKDMVEEFVKAVTAKIKENGTLVVEGVGVISRDEKGNPVLTPVTSKLSIDNYGMDTEEVEPVQPGERVAAPVAAAASAPTSKGKTVQQPDTKTTKVSTVKTTTTTTTTKTEEKKSGLLKTLLIILPIVAILAILFVLFKDKILGPSSDEPKPFVEASAPEDVTVIDIESDTQKDNNAAASPSDEEILAGVGFANVSPMSLGAKYKKYYLVGGSFKDKQGANQEMRRLGGSEVLHVDGTDLYRVILASSDSAQDIVDAYNKFVGKGISAKNIWLLKNSTSSK